MIGMFACKLLHFFIILTLAIDMKSKYHIVLNELFSCIYKVFYAFFFI